MKIVGLAFISAFSKRAAVYGSSDMHYLQEG